MCSYLTDKEQKISWHSFSETRSIIKSTRYHRLKVQRKLIHFNLMLSTTFSIKICADFTEHNNVGTQLTACEMADFFQLSLVNYIKNRPKLKLS